MLYILTADFIISTRTIYLSILIVFEYFIYLIVCIFLIFLNIIMLQILIFNKLLQLYLYFNINSLIF